MKISSYNILYFLPVFLVCSIGREFRGLGIETIVITFSIVLSIIVGVSVKKVILHNLQCILGVVFLIIYLLINYYYNVALFKDGFESLSFFEDVYAVFVFLFFYSLGSTINLNDNEVRGKVFLSIIFGVFVNLLLCFIYYGDSWREIFFQRLWNPYILFFLPLTYYLSQTKMSWIWSVPAAVLLFEYLISFQMKVIILVVVFSAVMSSRVVKVNGIFLGWLGVFLFLFFQIFSLIVDPFILAQIDHNFGVRAVFWGEAFESFLNQPYGLNLGVTVVSGDMSAIGEEYFQGGGDIQDVGVHSGFMSLLYKFGVFSLIFYFLVFKVFFKFSSVSSKNKSGYLVVLFVSFLSFFSNDSVFVPHFNAGLAFLLGCYNLNGRLNGGSADKLNNNI